MTKKLHSSLFLSFAIVFTMSAQDLKISNEKMIQADTTFVTYESKQRPALSYEVDTDVKSLKKHWKKFISDLYGAKYKVKETNVLATEDVSIATISNKRINLYATVVEKIDVSEISFSAAFGYDIYVDSEIYSEEFRGLKAVAEKFLLESSELYYADKINGFSKEITKLNKKNVSLNKKNDKMNGLITKTDVKLTVLNKENQGETIESVKVLNKISKLTKKQAGYKESIIENKKAIEDNKIRIVELNKMIDLKLAKAKSLKL